MLVGNKGDRQYDREVSHADGLALAKDLSCEFVEISAKDGIDVEKVFYDFVRLLGRQRKELSAEDLLEDRIASAFNSDDTEESACYHCLNVPFWLLFEFISQNIYNQKPANQLKEETTYTFVQGRNQFSGNLMNDCNAASVFSTRLKAGKEDLKVKGQTAMKLTD